jgi:hypothetical protein
MANRIHFHPFKFTMVNSAEDLSADGLQMRKKYLKGLKRGLFKYFPEPGKSFLRAGNPFLIKAETMLNNLSASEEEQLLELTSDGFLKPAFQQNTLTSFWLSVHAEYSATQDKLNIFCHSPPHTCVS